MKKLSELITNDNGRLSTTFALFCGGGVATKGFANALNNRGREE